MALLKYLVRKRKFIIILVLTCYAVFMVYTWEKVSVLATSVVKKGQLENHEETLQDTMLERIDWNNYSLMERDSKRTGLMEHGIGVELNLTREQEVERKRLLDKYKYDAYLSDRISLERSIGDIRPEACKSLKYMKDIPENSVSIIMPMFNEKNSTLLRSIYNIINRSPASLLKEIILVDDFSEDDELKAPLEDYIREHFSKVKIIRNKQREGLIRTKVIGADASTGRFLVFMESHTEVSYNYLPPLLEMIMLDYRTIACPSIDFHKSNFEINTMPEKRVRGGFNWSLDYKRIPVTVPMDEVTPHNSYIMLGGYFAISRKWWEELGKYDPGLDIWGAEQFELSVKCWLCGGRLVDLPCSRVVHLTRDWPYIDSLMAAVFKNYVRFAAVWMDGYREVVFQRNPSWRNIHPGNDVIKQVELRSRMKCKSFDWFLTEVAPDFLEFFPIVEPLPLAWGHLISKSNSSLCAYFKNEFTYLADCNSEHITDFRFDWRNHIVDSRDQSFSSLRPNWLTLGNYCEIDFYRYQIYGWDPDSGRIINPFLHLCIDFKPENLQLFMSDCVDNKSSQSWTFQFFNSSQVVEAWDKYTKTMQ